MYLFCCLYYPVENRENLALSQVNKEEQSQNETELSLGNFSEQTTVELQDLPQSSRCNIPPNSPAKAYIV